MADYKSTHTGAEIDAGIDKAATAESNWSLLMANLGIGRWRNQDFFTDYVSTNIIYDNMFKYYTNYNYCFANVGFVDAYSNVYNTKPIIMDIVIKGSNVDNASISLTNLFYGFKNASTLELQVDEEYSYFGSCGWMFAWSNLTAITVKGNAKIKGRWFGRTFSKCPNLVSIDGFDMSTQQSNDNLFWDSPKLKHIGFTHWKLSFDIHWSTAFEESDLVEIISNLDAVTITQTLTMGTTNLAKLTDDEKKVATDKGWVLA